MVSVIAIFDGFQTVVPAYMMRLSKFIFSIMMRLAFLTEIPSQHPFTPPDLGDDSSSKATGRNVRGRASVDSDEHDDLLCSKLAI